MKRLHFYCGYAFGGLRDLEPWTHAVVVGPEWVRRAVRESDRPLVLDNGAYPAWARGEKLTYDRQRQTLEGAIEMAGDRLLAVILPDVVGDGVESWRRTVAAATDLGLPASKQWVARQEGHPDEATRNLNQFGRVFVGGECRTWKMRESKALKRRGLTVHVGRIASALHLREARMVGVDSFDSTTPTRKMGSNPLTHWPGVLAQHCEPFDPNHKHEASNGPLFDF